MLRVIRVILAPDKRVILTPKVRITERSQREQKEIRKRSERDQKEIREIRKR